jgi:hypothetical protein
MENKRIDPKFVIYVINTLLDVDLLSKFKTREVADARIIYSKIMRDSGETTKYTGSFINKDHATVLHHIKQFNNIIDFDPKFKRNYEQCVEYINSNLSEENIVIDKNIKKQLILANQRINVLTLGGQNVERFLGILKVLNERVPSGKEDFVEAKLSTMLNGINYK